MELDEEVQNFELREEIEVIVNTDAEGVDTPTNEQTATEPDLPTRIFLPLISRY